MNRILVYLSDDSGSRRRKQHRDHLKDVADILQRAIDLDGVETYVAIGDDASPAEDIAVRLSICREIELWTVDKLESDAAAAMRDLGDELIQAAERLTGGASC